MQKLRQSTRSYRRAAIAAALAGLVAAGCASGSSATSATSASSSSSGSTSVPKSTATGSPILIGGQGDLSSNVGVADGFEARIAAANAAGGIDGRPIKFAGMLDDNLSAQTNLTNSQKLVESDHVVAVAPYISEVCTSSGPGFLETNKTPFIGYATCTGWLGNNWGIGVNGNQANYHLQSEGGAVELIAAMEHMPSMHVTKPSDVKLAVIGFNTADGVFATDSLSAAAKAAGIDVVYAKAPIPYTTTNFAPYAQDVIGSGANAVYEITDAPLSVGLSAALKAANFQGFAFDGVTYLPGQLASSPSEEAALNGVGVSSEFPVNEDNIPAVKTEEQQLAAAGKPTNLTTGISIGYWSGDVLVQLLKATAARVGASNITGAAIQATAAAGWTYTGGLGTMTYPAAWTYPTGCSTLVQEEGTGYRLLEPYTCTPKYAKTGF
jgi:ABC-type branched-subunit amino acid transport system substrate-binding protein